MAARKIKRTRLSARARRGRKKLAALFTAALAIPGIICSSSYAQDMPAAPTFRVQYSDYRDFQAGYTRRMRSMTPSLLFSAPLGEKTALDLGAVVDVLTGASPYYHNTLTGASGLGVEDKRRAGDVKVTHYFERFSLGIGATVSTEDDYFSRGSLADIRWWTEDRNTTIALGASFHGDDISSSSNADIDEQRDTADFLVGVTQVVSPNAILQSNITLSNGHGYFSDPYKIFDNRPDSRRSVAWLTRYNLYLPGWEGSLHSDYRFYHDTWGVNSHTVEVAWYQPLGDSWLIRPSLRYYTQSSARFYSNDYPPVDFERNYSADQRLGDFGGFSPALKLSKELGSGVSANLMFEFIWQRPDFKLGSSRSSVIEPFYATLISAGLVKTF